MEKLFNWTIGSFFRTIGRLIAYFAIGAFIAYILSNSNIKLPRITNLFFEKVNAASLTIPVRETGQLFFNAQSWSSFDVTSDQSQVYKTIYSNDDQIHEYINFQVSDSFDTSRFDYVEFNMSMTYPKVMNYQNTFTDHTCYEYSCSRFEPGTNDCSEWYCSSYHSHTEGLSVTTIPAEINTFNFYFNVVYQDNTVSECTIDNSAILCPTHNKRISTLNIFVNFKAVKTTTFDFYLRRRITGYSYDSGVQSSIENQTQQQQQQHNETMTIITDTNTTTEQNETISFFEGFEFSSDNTGLVGVITAPLRVINSIVNAQFSDLCFTLKSKNVCFPNGNMIWQKSNRDSTWFGSGSISTGIQAFVSLFNLVAGGYILYKMGVSIKRLTEDLINPTNTRIEVMKL